MFPFALLGSRSIHSYLLVLLSALTCFAPTSALWAQDSAGEQDKAAETPAASTNSGDLKLNKMQEKAVEAIAAPATDDKPAAASNRVVVLIGSLTIFILAIFVGFEIINKVPPTLHTPLMSGSNAISGITIVGALLATGFTKLGFGSFFGLAAIVLAMINIAGGFWVTHRMLAMFKKK